MAEDFTFAAPVHADAGATRFRVSEMVVSWDRSLISVSLREWDGANYGARQILATYTGAQARSLMTALNKADLSAKSLQQRVLEQLAADGKLPTGTIGGTPD